MLLGWISSGAVLGVWLGIPCATWSITHTTPLVRTKKCILGIPDLYGKQLAAVKRGNGAMQFSSEVIHACIRNRVPCCLEHPVTSKLFYAPPLRSLRSHPSCQEFVSDHCQYGTQWKRSTMVPMRRRLGANSSPTVLAAAHCGRINSSAGALLLGCLGHGSRRRTLPSGHSNGLALFLTQP